MNRERFKEAVDYFLPWKLRKFLKNLRREADDGSLTKEKIKKLLRKDDPIVLEIGANSGIDSMEFLDEFKNIRLFCFEPDPRAIKKFERRVRDKRCYLFKIALSDKNGEVDFYMSGGMGMKEGWDLSSSIKKPTGHLKMNSNISFDKKIIVDTKKLDSWVEENNIGQIDFIWADVQGAERELINGGLRTLNYKTRYFYTEFSNEELYEGQPTLKEICDLLPNFKMIKIFGGDVLLKDSNLK